MQAPKDKLAFALGTWLASRSALVRASLVLSALGALGSVAVAMAARDASVLRELPRIASLALCWGAGVMLAVGGALHAGMPERQRGVLALVRARGIRLGPYVAGRVAGLVVWLAVAVVGGTLVASFAATARASADREVVRGALGATVYALAFALTLGPLAMAALSGGTRARGYLVLSAVLVVPELLVPWTRTLLPPAWSELTSIPAALDALSEGVESSHVASERVARALVGLAAVAAFSLVVVGARMPHRVTAEDA